jgi:hypothetical protein
MKVVYSERLRQWYQNATPEQKADMIRKQKAACPGVRAQVVALLEEHPDWSVREMAATVGVSKERVYQIRVELREASASQ